MQWNRDGNWRRSIGNDGFHYYAVMEIIRVILRRSQIALAGSVAERILRLSSGDCASTVVQPACQMSLRVVTGYRKARYARSKVFESSNVG
jgi:hypothetical protein